MTIFTENRRPPDRVRTNSARCPVRTLFDAFRKGCVRPKGGRACFCACLHYLCLAMTPEEYRLLLHIDSPEDRQKALRGGVARLLRRVATLYRRRMFGKSRTPRGRVWGLWSWPPPCIMSSTRPPIRSCGTWGTRPMPTRSSRPPRSVQNQAPAGGHQRLPAHVRERIRRFRRGTRLGVDLGGLRHGQGGRTAGREVSGRGGHRRRFDDRRAGLRRLNNAGASKRTNCW